MSIGEFISFSLNWSPATKQTLKTHKWKKIHKKLYKCKICGIHKIYLFKEHTKCYCNDEIILRDISCGEYSMEQILK